MAHPSASSAGPVTDVAAAGAPFSTALREATADLHRRAERTGFVADLLRGRATRAGYTLFLRNLVPVYAALETALDRHVGGEACVLSPFLDERLRRLPSLRADLDALAGADWERTCLPLPEAEAHALAIRSTGSSDGTGPGDAHRLVAHAYTRILGDLSGGQILRALLARSHDLGPDALAFYDFPALADLNATKAAMRAALDAVPSRSDAAATIIAEALDAFRHTISVSEAVGRAALRAG